MITGTKILCVLGFCLVFSSGTNGQRKGLQVIKQWANLTWSYATAAEEHQAIKNGEYIIGNSLPNDMDAYYKDDGSIKIFLSVPRSGVGTPATLNTVSGGSINPKLKPYPSWDWHRNSSACHRDRLVSVFRTQIDDCGRLWVLDTGKIGNFDSVQLCNPQIIAFEPSTDKVLYRYEIPRDQISNMSTLVTPIVDVRNPQGACRDTFVYVADGNGFNLIVIDIQKNESWRIQNKLFYPIPESGTFSIAGASFDLMTGVLGMALSPYKYGEDRLLYFHALSSNTENYVNTSVLRNGTLFRNNANAVPRQFSVFKSKRPSQSLAEAMDRDGIMYFGLAHEITINCWNTNANFNERNFGVVGDNPVTMQFARGVKIINTRIGGQELWVTTTRINKVATDTSDISYRILKAATEDLLQGNKCKNSREAFKKKFGAAPVYNRKIGQYF